MTAISLLSLSNLALAFCLKGNSTVAEEYADTEMVFTGSVMAENNVPESQNYDEGTEYKLEVLETFKGKPSNPIFVFSENTSGRFPMEIGKKYILFIDKALDGYQVDNCGNSKLLNENLGVLEKIRELNKDE